MTVLRENHAKLQEDCAKWRSACASLEKNKALLLHEREAQKATDAETDRKTRELKELNQRLRSKVDEAEKTVRDAMDERSKLLRQSASQSVEELKKARIEFELEVCVWQAERCACLF